MINYLELFIQLLRAGLTRVNSLYVNQHKQY